jgi:hypothetical protein
MPEQFPQPETPKSELSFESWLHLDVPKQYQEQIQILNRLGLLDFTQIENPVEMDKGIVGIDNQEYAIPKLADIQRVMQENQEQLETKRKQGFSEIQITPFALPLQKLLEIVQKQLLKHAKEKKLFLPKTHLQDPDVPFELNENEPLWKWDGYDQADTQGKLVYFPQAFQKENHRGQTKTQILSQAQSFPGFRVTLQEKNQIIPRAGQGQTIGGRKQPEANLTPQAYLQKMQTDPQYQNEQGLTPEEWLIKLLIHLEKTNQVLDLYDANHPELGSYCYNLGGWFPASGDVSGACCDRGGRQAGLNRHGPAYRNSNVGCRGAVRV